MRPWILILLPFAGCATYNTPKDDTDPGVDTAWKDSYTTWTESDTDSDSDSDSDTDADTDTDTDTDADPGLCVTSWDVVDQTGWVKEFKIDIADLLGFGAGSGTARMESYGTDSVYGTTAYSLADTVSAGSMYAWSGVAYIRCESGGTSGMFLYGWDVSAQGTQLDLEFSEPRMYLPPDSQIGTYGSWSYDYETYMDMGTGPTPVNLSGDYTELGFESYTLPDGTAVSAYHLNQSYLWDSDLGTNSGNIESWWVEGLGLVKEVNNQDDGVTALVRELTSYTGLTPN